MKRCIALFLSLLLFGALFAGCSKQTNTGGKMHYDLSAEPQNLDPQTATDLASMTVIAQIYEPLFTLDAAGALIPAAADGYTLSADGLTYRIQLKSGLRWSNDAILDAEDFAFGLKRLLMPETVSPHASKFFGIAGAKEYNAGECGFEDVGISYNGIYLTVTLVEPDADFLHLLTLTAASACDEAFFYGTKGKYGLEAEATLSNGAFYLQTWSHDQYLKLTKNPNYREADAVMIAGVTMWTNNIEGREETFWNGKTQCCYVSGESYAENASDSHTADAISNTVYGIVMNQNTEALQNKSIRKAIAALFDRAGYAEKLPAYLTVYDRLYPSDCAVGAVPYYKNAGAISASASVEQAKKWYQDGIGQVGVAALSGLKIVVLEEEDLPNGDYFLSLSQQFQKEFDLYIGIERLAKEEYDAAIAAGEYDLAIVAIESEDLSPYTLLSDFVSGHFACDDAEFLSLYAAASSANSALQQSIYEQAEEILLCDGWFIPMYEKAQYFVCGDNVTGVTYNPYTGLVSFANAQYVEE